MCLLRDITDRRSNRVMIRVYLIDDISTSK